MPGHRKSSGKPAQRDAPLAGKRILVTRARGQARALSAALRKKGATVWEIPFIEILPPKSWARLDQAVGRLASYDWLILTSVNGVQALLQRMKKRKVPVQELGGVQIAAIGPATRAEIERAGLRVRVTPAEYVAEAVVRRLRGRAGGKRVLLVRAEVARDVIPRELRKAGAQVEVVEAYRARLPKRSKGKLAALLRDPSKTPHIVTFTSSSIARNFWQAARGKNKLLDEVSLASVGPVTSRTLRELGMRAHTQAKRYTMAGLTAAICRYAAQPSQRARVTGGGG